MTISDPASLSVLVAFLSGTAAAVLWWRLRGKRHAQRDVLNSMETVSLVRNIPVGIVALDAGLRVVFVNPAAERLFSVSASTVLGKDINDALHLESPSAEVFREHVLRPMERGEVVVNHEDALVLAKGVRHVSVTTTQLGTAGAPEGFLVSFVDVEMLHERSREVQESLRLQASQTEALEQTKTAMLNLLEDLNAEKQAVEAEVVRRMQQFNEEHARLMASIGSISMGFAFVGLDGSIALANRAMRVLFGVEGVSEVHLSNLQQAISSGANLETARRECLGSRATVELKDVVTVGGVYLRLLCTSIWVVREGHEESIGVALIAEDVTQERVAARSREEFFNVASHELRTPLTAIRGNAEMLLEFLPESAKTPDFTQMLSDIREGAVRLIAIVNDFLDASRLEQRAMKFVIEDFALDELITDTLRDLNSVASSRGLWLKAEGGAEGVRVHGDRSRTKQVLINLIGNALNYTKEGGVTIVPRVDGNQAVVAVTDTGVGISREGQEMLFRKFQQANDKLLTRDVVKGTGLGLYISKLLIENMGGRIALEKSAPEEGSTFSFSIPLTPKA